ncbi:hypothetical protein J8L98_01405 [Pseudoalteromonas sp. MMG013]|uniref:hypothetical protein n=1 Tax=Pseudoalteromonas sp. MMG013 TaxID=2822687 RepID=UPI001B38F5DC|nr:hypothetical protein [Pseudoalteromonas sp. MMG013]MBQ4860345.1 hypothetical protein [Pseudoalteromonas sp. MMG013]
MGSKSRSSSRQATHNSNTSLGVHGDNNGYMTVGNGNTYNISQTDHGLVEALVDIGGNMADQSISAIDAASDMAYYNNGMVESVTNDAFSYGRDINSDSLDFARDTVNSGFDFGSDSLDVASNALQDAFAFGGSAMQTNGSLALDALSYQNGLANEAMANNADLAGDMIASAEGMHARNNAFASNLFGDAVGAIEQSGQQVSDMAYFTANKTSDLASEFAAGSSDLAALAMEHANQAYSEMSDKTVLSSKQALQFADNMSRSDGQQLAKDTNKTMMYVVVGVVGVTVLAMMGKK